MVQISNSLTFPIDPPQQQYYENELGDHTFDGQSAVLGGLLGGMYISPNNCCEIYIIS